MSETLMQSVIWLSAGGCLLYFLRRRRTKKVAR
jgi:hypothetical protein